MGVYHLFASVIFVDAYNIRMHTHTLTHAGSDEGKTYCVRGMMNMQHTNLTLRDPVYYRVNTATPHHRTGSKYNAYPTYDFACPIVVCACV
jgi:glutamyl/glutaminyl-tRNA synthetase